jgi:hypothetical protein
VASDALFFREGIEGSRRKSAELTTLVDADPVTKCLRSRVGKELSLDEQLPAT